MRCTSCGLPLSPQRTHCPRCGKEAGVSGKQEEKANDPVGVPQFAFSTPQESNNIFAGAETIQGPPVPFAQQQINNQMPNPIFYAAGAEQFPNLPSQPLPEQDRTLLSNPEQSANWQSSSQPDQRNAPPSEIRPGSFQPFPNPAQRPAQAHSRPKMQPGFTIAGLCVVAGGFILMLVYIISLNLPPVAANNQATSTIAAHTPAAQNATPGGLPANVTPTASLPTPTPTPDLPGKAYIDNAQMSSNVDLNTALASQATTTFTVNQKVFVTFMLHPPSSGAVCLLWSIDQKQFSQFAFPVDAVSQHAYSFAFPRSAGQGQVNLYWASSTTCTDKQLAQTVNFTVVTP